MLETLELWDQQLLVFLNGFHASWLDRPVYILTQTAASAPWVLLLLYLAYRRGGWPLVAWLFLGAGFVILFSDQSSVHLFKNVFQRYRPSHHAEVGQLLHFVSDWNGNLYKGGQYGFVSSHATNFFGLATFFWLSLRPANNKVFWLIFGWATLISYTRIYLGVHYPGDILGGALLGAMIGFMVWKITDVLRKKYLVAPKNV